jgi:hypothetical protein
MVTSDIMNLQLQYNKLLDRVLLLNPKRKASIPIILPMFQLKITLFTVLKRWQNV